MNVVIVEDEVPASAKLEQLIEKYDKNVSIIKILRNIEDAVHFFSGSKDKIDLIFMDIQLADGISFEIFKQVEINTPIIFTTAYNEYAIEAFTVNSIDYLLKPIKFDKLVKSFEKFKNLPKHLSNPAPNIDLNTLANLLTKKEDYKSRFMVKIGEHIHSVKTEEIACFYSDGRIVYLLTNAKRKFIVDFKLEELEKMLNPTNFMRVQRSFIININSIKDVIVYSKTRLRVLLHIDFDKEIIISREKTKVFKEWLNG